MIILPLFIYLFCFDFCIYNNLFYLTDFIIRCFLGWDYSVDDEKKHAVYDGVRCRKWRMLDGVDSMEQEETIQDTRN